MGLSKIRGATAGDPRTNEPGTSPVVVKTFTVRLPWKLLGAGTNGLSVQAITGAGNGGAATVSSSGPICAPG